MRILVIGSGGREHAIVWKLAQDPTVTGIHCFPGSDAIGQVRMHNGKLVNGCISNIPETEIAVIARVAIIEGFDLTIVGPEAPLFLGIVDEFRKRGFPIVGPTKQAARWEESKAFAQEAGTAYGISQPHGMSFTTFQGALNYAARWDYHVAVKADGPARGKGALICGSEQEVRNALFQCLRLRVFKDAGARVVVQQCDEGEELSVHLLCDGVHEPVWFPPSRDYKRLLDNDRGPNTGGMGGYTDGNFDALLRAEILIRIVRPWQDACLNETPPFTGFCYPGIMLVNGRMPKALEFNVRMGDPETELYMRRLDGGLLEGLMGAATGTLTGHPFRWSQEAVVGVVLAAEEYPEDTERAELITGIDDAEGDPRIVLFHNDTRLVDGKWYTNGGRVLTVTARAGTLQDARDCAYRAAQKIRFDGMHYRTDIARSPFPACV